ncbi:MAG TPA: YkgJ family cysteine cluster protein [Steroidobacteraceae bacterium]|jgi:hypothetical protein
MSMPPVQPFGSQAVAQIFGHSTDVDACIALVTQINQLLDEASARLQEPGSRLACQAGCNFCCHLRVMLLPHEAIALFRYLQSRMPVAAATQVRAKLREYTRPASASPAPPGPVTPRPCAFLVNGECSAYEVRPGACAAYHSLSKERCELSYRDPAVPSGIVALQALRAVGEGMQEGVSSGVAAQGLSNIPLELHTAVAALLADPALIARWRAGRPLLKSP